jgi:hypothetical protein
VALVVGVVVAAAGVAVVSLTCVLRVSVVFSFASTLFGRLLCIMKRIKVDAECDHGWSNVDLPIMKKCWWNRGQISTCLK